MHFKIHEHTRTEVWMYANELDFNNIFGYIHVHNIETVRNILLYPSLFTYNSFQDENHAM